MGQTLTKEEWARRYGGGTSESRVISKDEWNRRYSAPASTPEPEPERKGLWDSLTQDSPLAPMIGAAKGLGSTVYGLGALASKIPGVSEVAEAFGASPEYAKFEQPKPEALKPKGVGQQAGFLGEQLAEFFVPAAKIGNVAKGTKLLSSTRALNIGKNALADAAVTTAQSGDVDSFLGAGAGSAGIQAGMGVVGKGLGAVGKGTRSLIAAAKGPADEIVQLAEKYGVNLSAGQEATKPLLQRLEGTLRKWGVTQDIFQKADKSANARLQKVAADVADDISKSNMTEVQAGEYIGEALEAAGEAASIAYGAKVEPLIAQFGQVDVPLAGGIADTARELLKKFSTGDIKAPQQVESVGAAMRILEDLSQPVHRFAGPNALNNAVAAGVQVTNDMVLQAARNPGGFVLEIPKKFTLSDAKNMRTLLFKMSNKGQVDMGKGAVAQMNSAIDAAMKQSLEAAGGAPAVSVFEEASKGYRQTQELFENTIISRLSKSDRPGDIVNYLLTQAPETGATKLRALIGPTKMQAVERSLWEKILTGSTEDGILVGQKLKKTLDNLGPEARAAIFPDPQRLQQVEELAKLADNLAHTKKLAGDPAMQGAGYMGLGVSGFGTAATFSVLSGNLPGAILAGAGLATWTLGPRKMAKILSTPGGAAIAKQAMTTPPGTPRGRMIAQVLARIAGAKAGGAMSEEDEDEQP